MRKTIEGRELFTLETLNVILQGTYHKPWLADSAKVASAFERNRIGILLLNGLSAVRSSKGDSAVYWADALSAQGYSLFRLDLPGYGDSEGELPPDQLGFINQGDFAPVVSKAIDELAKAFNLANIVLIANCSGSVSAIYTAVINKKCAGIVLMNPYFHLARIKASGVRHLLRTWASRSGDERVLVRVYKHSKETLLRFRGTHALPDNANRSLLRYWKQLASTGFPILILTTGVKPKTSQFDYLKHLLDLAGPNNQVSVRTIEGAHHSFSNRPGRAMVRQFIQAWLEKCFSPPECGHGKVTESGSTVWQCE